MSQKFTLYILLLLTGVAWGLTTPLTVLAVSTGYQALGLVFWQEVIIILMAGAYILAKRRRVRLSLGFVPLFLGIVLLGSLFPDSFLYIAAAHLQGGVLSILVAMVPMISLPLALAFGYERPDLVRLIGACCGAIAVILLVVPETGLPESVNIFYVFVALMAAVLYAMQGIFITWKGTEELDAIDILFGSAVVGLVVITPFVVATGQFVNLFKPWDVADWSLIGVSVFHGLAYGGYFYLIARAGPVFTSQVAYLITGSGVLWSILLLSESYSGWIWSSLGLMFLGMLLIQPKKVEKATKSP